MEYTGKSKKMYSEVLQEDVIILQYRSRHNAPYCTCSRCGRDIKRLMYVVQSCETDIELMYLGSCCVKKLT